ncbi:hypothetical protein RchiOBHm_Chr3g0451601 [Rosa chinensis]|uniref:Uncharacterized protein n=1 Tax=Rosa chinensis TaxID=74649 RepID=A0A2P6R625_ROSCH|nr:hypothetical protein RchiOBHm_Chr3g0451601 [Rosa chinensis]
MCLIGMLGMGRSWLEKLSMVMMVTHILSCFGIVMLFYLVIRALIAYWKLIL